MLRTIALFALLSLLGCDSPNSSPPPPPPPPPPFSGSFTSSAWSITQGSNPRPLVNGSFDFQGCAYSTACHDSYVEAPLPVSLTGAQTFTLTYTITGDNPVFSGVTDTCSEVPPSLSLILHEAGDNMSGVPPYDSYRWYSKQVFQQKLELGTHTISVPFVLSNWINVYGQSTDSGGFAGALVHLGSAGFGLGGGCAAAHGVSVSSGSAKFQINEATIQ